MKKILIFMFICQSICCQDIIKIKKGEVSLSTGFLVSEEKFKEFAEIKKELERYKQLEAYSQISIDKLEKIESLSAKQIETYEAINSLNEMLIEDLKKDIRKYEITNKVLFYVNLFQTSAIIGTVAGFTIYHVSQQNN